MDLTPAMDVAVDKDEKPIVEKLSTDEASDGENQQQQSSHPPSKEAESGIDDVQESEEINLEEIPVSMPPDLSKVSEEIDEYIAALSSSSAPPEDVPISVEQFAALVEAKIESYDHDDSIVKWGKLSDEESSSFLEIVDRISSLYESISKFSAEYKYGHSINRIGGVLHRAMSYIEEEFRSLMEDSKIQDSDSVKHKPSSNIETEQRDSPNSASVEEKQLPGGYSAEILSSLMKLSKAMVSGGFEPECCHIYFVARRNAMEECTHKLGFDKYSIDDVQKMGWESLEKEIVNWIRAFKQFTTELFPRERELADAVFPDQHSISENLSGSLSYAIMIQLLNFAESVALTKRAAEKLFKFLDVYEALGEIMQTIDNLFPEKWAGKIRTEVMMIRTHLGEAMVLIFNELEHSINSDLGKTPVPGGSVHPLTRYIINYMRFAVAYKETLEQVFREHQKIERADSATGSDFDYNSQVKNHLTNEVVKESPFQSQVIKVMDLLDSNLEGKSKLYKDTSLSMIFLMNNGRYTLQKIKGSNELYSIMGNTWCRRRSSDLRQYHKTYQRETWGKLLSCLHPEGLTVNGKVVKPVLKERFKSFNAMFDEIHKTQSSWVVSDEQLQSELRVSISNMVIPAYRSFLGRFSQIFTPGRQTEKYIKFQGEDIETYIDELFDGNAAAAVGRRKG